jgi:hypothetical protein
MLSHNSNQKSSLSQRSKLTISIPIAIPKSSSFSNTSTLLEEYSLKCNTFNPGKMSPPDEWKERLEQRIKAYYTTISKLTETASDNTSDKLLDNE